MGGYNVGDKVVIVENVFAGKNLEDFGLMAGDKGEVVAHEDDFLNYPIVVKFERTQATFSCSPKELKLDNGYSVSLL